ncbi:MAG: alpha-L-fucosidase, partial [Sphingobacteriaceae bacterium]
MIVLSIKGTAKINCTLNFQHRPVQWEQWPMVNSGIKKMTAGTAGEWLTYSCEFKNHYPGKLQGFEGAGRLILKGGSSHVKDNKLVITDADEVMMLVSIKPSYQISSSNIAVMQRTLSTVNSGYETLLSKHAVVHGELFNKCKLTLNGTPADRGLFSEELLLKGWKQVSHALIEKVFDAGRYNIISSMGANPPNLQGIWTGTWTAPWSADYTHDGNVPSAIASVLSTDMASLMNAYFNYHERNMAIYRDNAKKLFGVNGIHVPAHSTTNGLDTDFSETWCLTFWTGAAGWASAFFFDYYEYVQDQAFLKKRAYPFMKEAALFYEEFLTTGKDGKLVFNPSYSPENNPANNKSQAAINATMDVMICKELLRNCIKAANILHTDKDKIKKWEHMLKVLPDYEVAADGTLREWLWPGMRENAAHRHVSQLYSLFNKADDDILGNRNLLKAVNRTLDEKLRYRNSEGGGEMAFGLVQLGLAAAHIGEAEKAKQTVDWLASRYWSAGMGSFHNVGELFNTDISGGLPAVITEMLIYADAGEISLLPALPAEWDTGVLEGVRLRGNVEVKKLEWAKKSIVANFYPHADKKLKLKIPGKIRSLIVNGTYIKP